MSLLTQCLCELSKVVSYSAVLEVMSDAPAMQRIETEFLCLQNAKINENQHKAQERLLQRNKADKEDNDKVKKAAEELINILTCKNKHYN